MLCRTQRAYIGEILHIFQFISKPKLSKDRFEEAKRALDLIQKVEKWPEDIVVPLYWIEAVMHFTAGKAIQEISERSVDVIEVVLSHYNIALDIFLKDQPSYEGAFCCAQAADTYMDRQEGLRSENINAAIQLYNFAITYFSEINAEENLLQAKVHLATAYLEFEDASIPLNIEKGIAELIDVLPLLSRFKDKDIYFKEIYCSALVNLADAYSRRIHGSGLQNKKMRLFCLALY